MNKKLKKVLIELAVAVLAGYIVVCLPAPGTGEVPAPVKQEPHLIMVQSSGIMPLDLVATAVSKPHTEDSICADA